MSLRHPARKIEAPMMNRNIRQDTFTFTLVWLGQLVSLSGTRLTSFALGVWVYQRTGSATQFALIAVFSVLPYVLLSPVAGALVDRWDRRRIMILSDTGAGLTTLVMVMLLSSGALDQWQIYAAATINSILNAFQEPAYVATVPLLVPKQHLGRANGLVQAGRAVAKLVAPAVAGVLVTTIGLQGVMLVDGATFIFALASLLVVRFPKYQGAISSGEVPASLRREVVDGWTYLAARPALLLLLGFFAWTNFLVNMVAILATPAILSMADARVLGTVMSAGGLGMLFGSLLMSAWGGPKRQIYAVLGFVATLGLGLIIAGLHPSPLFFAAGAFLAYFSLPLFQGSGQAILQSKVAPGIQGRVFALRGMVVSLTMLVAFLGAGPLADHVFEPLLAAEGSLAGSVGTIIGKGPGRGIGLMFILMGLLTILTAVGGLLAPRLRRVDVNLPDFELDEPVIVRQKPGTPTPILEPEKGQNAFSGQPATLSEPLQ